MENSNNKLIEAIQEKLPSKNTVIRGAVAAIPYVGGLLDHLIFDKSGEIFQRNIQLAIDNISNRISELEESTISKDWFESEEALSLMQTLVEKVKYEQNKQKVGVLSRVYTQFGTITHVKDPNKFAVLEAMSKMTINQFLVFNSVNQVPAEKKEFSGGALVQTATARWQSTILQKMQSDKQVKDMINGRIILNEELDILVSFNLLAYINIVNANDTGVRVTRLGEMVYDYLTDIEKHEVNQNELLEKEMTSAT